MTAVYFYLQDKKSGRCVHPIVNGNNDNVALVFRNRCSGSQLQFKALPAENGYIYLQSAESHQCVHPLGGLADKDNTALVSHKGCSGSRLQFKLLPAIRGVYLQSRDHGRCVHPSGGSANEDEPLVFHTGCKGDNIVFKLKYAVRTTSSAPYPNRHNYTYTSSYTGVIVLGLLGGLFCLCLIIGIIVGLVVVC